MIVRYFTSSSFFVYSFTHNVVEIIILAFSRKGGVKKMRGGKEPKNISPLDDSKSIPSLKAFAQFLVQKWAKAIAHVSLASVCVRCGPLKRLIFSICCVFMLPHMNACAALDFCITHCHFILETPKQFISRFSIVEANCFSYLLTFCNLLYSFQFP